MVEAVAYLRTSSAANVDGHSPHRQSDAIMGYAGRAGCQISVAFWDAAVSGADPIETREGFAALMSHCEAERISLVIVEDPTRFARSVIALELGVALLAEHGIRLVTSTGHELTDDTDSSKVFMRQVFGAAAEYEKAKTVERLRKAREKIRSAKGKCEGRRSHAELHPRIVQEARRLARRNPKTGKTRSLRVIARELADLGLTSSRRTPLSASVVSSLIR